MTVTRPALRYLGGKWLLAPWIIAHLPPHRTYVEPFAGAASVLLRKPRAYSEVYNDLGDDVVGLFRVLRDADMAAQLVEALRLTPFARVEFEESYTPTLDPVERARRLVVRSYMGFGSGAANVDRGTGFRRNATRAGSIPAHDWARYPDALLAVVERMQGVIVEQRPAMEVMERFDSDETAHYVDPPYLHETRSQKRIKGQLHHAYPHELTDADHVELLAFLQTLKGPVVLSGYPSPLYDDALVGWRRVEKDALADGARERRECLWLSPATQAQLNRAGVPAPQQDMFG